MIKFYLTIVFVIHLIGLFRLIDSGNKSKIGLQLIVLIWSGCLLVFQELNPIIFIIFSTIIYTFAFLILTMAYYESGDKTFRIPILLQATMATLGLMALIS